jgi:hypothetical protein
MRKMAAAGLAALAVAGAWPAVAQSARERQELERLSAERSEERGRFLRSREGRGRAPVPGSPPKETIRELPGRWFCAGAEANAAVFEEPDALADQMGWTLPYVATRGVREGMFLEVLHSSGLIGYVPLYVVLDDRNELRPYEPAEGVAARQCTVAGVRASDGTLVFRFQ